jgi:hypothetical protein
VKQIASRVELVEMYRENNEEFYYMGYNAV